MVVEPRVRNNIFMNAHPLGCAAEVRRQISWVKSKPRISGPKRVLVVGASTGYGLASRIVAAFGAGASTLGIAFEKEGSEKRTGTAGWYNMKAFDADAARDGIPSASINADAFADEVKAEAVSLIKERFGEIDLLVYSLASPVRTDPKNRADVSLGLEADRIGLQRDVGGHHVRRDQGFLGRAGLGRRDCRDRQGHGRRGLAALG